MVELWIDDLWAELKCIGIMHTYSVKSANTDRW